MGFIRSIEKMAREMGAAYFGIADLGLAKDGHTSSYEAGLISKYNQAVSIGYPLLDSIVEGLTDREDIFALSNYRFHVYEVVNPRINDITLSVAEALMDKGYKALAVPASHTVDLGNLSGLFSHKMAANLAGMGWIGKSCLLITPDRGPRVRWGTVLTDYIGIPGKAVEAKGCGGCNICVESCPAGAFTGRNFIATEPRESRMDAKKCFQYIWAERKQKIGVEACGMCVYSCPFGKRKKSGR